MDGIDIYICITDSTYSKSTASGANNPLLHISEESASQIVKKPFANPPPKILNTFAEHKAPSVSTVRNLLTGKLSFVTFFDWKPISKLSRTTRTWQKLF